MRDKKGFLPAHVACSRHCSPEKLEMLLRVNSDSLFAETDDGSTLLGLAKSTATKHHPNYALIGDLERRVMIASMAVSLSPETTPFDVHSSADNINCWNQGANRVKSTTRSVICTSTNRNSRHSKFKRKRKSKATLRDRQTTKESKSEVDAVRQEIIPIKQEDSEPANLLLHFSRHMENVTSV